MTLHNKELEALAEKGQQEIVTPKDLGAYLVERIGGAININTGTGDVLGKDLVLDIMGLAKTTSGPEISGHIVDFYRSHEFKVVNEADLIFSSQDGRKIAKITFAYMRNNVYIAAEELSKV